MQYLKTYLFFKFLYYYIGMSVAFCIMFGIYFGREAAVSIFLDKNTVIMLLFLAAFATFFDFIKKWKSGR
ncbi:hypothetical protein BG910_06845 [Neisseria chenwenguii]|uniref:Uncharacterized protein n=2 Tax=Neisseria chenwenguii TaxID=1853278 RepID=A0A220S1Y9_9NEIS|nr:hypothetical protein BG910_06845 [Neisseria chenwenguii]ROV55579.1 hypothetical protein EGS38_08690 [Neisseria chenwenguii]